MLYPSAHRGLSLLEILVAISILAVLVSLAVAHRSDFQDWAQRTASLNSLRQVGVAFFSYAGDNNQRLPRRVRTLETGDGSEDGFSRWPGLLSEYLDSLRVYAAPGDPESFLRSGADPLSDERNNTSYIMNGFNDLGAFTDEFVEVRLPGIENPSQVILLGLAKSGRTHFYMDMLEGRRGNHITILDPAFYGTGSTYLFADGSARFLTEEEYDHSLWLIDKTFEIP